MNASEDVTVKTHIKQKEKRKKELYIFTVTKTLILRKKT